MVLREDIDKKIKKKMAQVVEVKKSDLVSKEKK